MIVGGGVAWSSAILMVKAKTMKAIIVQGIKDSYPAKGKKASKKYYTLTGPKHKMAASALKVLGALNALNKMFSTIGSYARKLVFDNVLPEWLKDVISGKKKIEAFTVTAEDAKALIVPMHKYAIITEERAGELYDLKKKHGIDIEIEEKKNFVFNHRLIEDIPEEKMTALMEEVTESLLKSKVLPAKVKSEIKAGKIAVIEEDIKYEYAEDILDNLPKLSEGSVNKAMAIVEAVKPVFAIRSFELEDKEVQMGQALDLIKANMDVMPDSEEE